MLSVEEKNILAKYKDVQTITDKERCTVTVMINLEDNQVAVKKVIHGNKADVYRKLKDIQSKNIPQIYYIMEEEGVVTVIEEFVEGQTLQELLESKVSINEDILLDTLEQLCEALKVLHNLPTPIIHRDIKPSNIIISKNGILKLIDFDAAREFKAENTKDTVCLGTLEYAAPEQFGYSQTDIRSDIYSIGMLIAEFIKYSDSIKANQRFCDSFQKVIDKCTMFDPKQRYQTIPELQAAVQKASKEAKGTKTFILWIPPLVGAFVLLAIIFLLLNHSGESNRDSYVKANTNQAVTALPSIQS